MEKQAEVYKLHLKIRLGKVREEIRIKTKRGFKTSLFTFILRIAYSLYNIIVAL